MNRRREEQEENYIKGIIKSPKELHAICTFLQVCYGQHYKTRSNGEEYPVQRHEVLKSLIRAIIMFTGYGKQVKPRATVNLRVPVPSGETYEDIFTSQFRQLVIEFIEDRKGGVIFFPMMTPTYPGWEMSFFPLENRLQWTTESHKLRICSGIALMFEYLKINPVIMLEGHLLNLEGAKIFETFIIQGDCDSCGGNISTPTNKVIKCPGCTVNHHKSCSQIIDHDWKCKECSDLRIIKERKTPTIDGSWVNMTNIEYGFVDDIPEPRNTRSASQRQSDSRSSSMARMNTPQRSSSHQNQSGASAPVVASLTSSSQAPPNKASNNSSPNLQNTREPPDHPNKKRFTSRNTSLNIAPLNSMTILSARSESREPWVDTPLESYGKAETSSGRGQDPSYAVLTPLSDIYNPKFRNTKKIQGDLQELGQSNVKTVTTISSGGPRRKLVAQHPESSVRLLFPPKIIQKDHSPQKILLLDETRTLGTVPQTQHGDHQLKFAHRIEHQRNNTLPGGSSDMANSLTGVKMPSLLNSSSLKSTQKDGLNGYEEQQVFHPDKFYRNWLPQNSLPQNKLQPSRTLYQNKDNSSGSNHRNHWNQQEQSISKKQTPHGLILNSQRARERDSIKPITNQRDREAPSQNSPYPRNQVWLLVQTTDSAQVHPISLASITSVDELYQLGVHFPAKFSSRRVHLVMIHFLGVDEPEFSVDDKTAFQILLYTINRATIDHKDTAFFLRAYLLAEGETVN